MVLTAFDTNILAYLEGVVVTESDRVKRATSRAIFERVFEEGGFPVVPVQALAELHHVLVRKGRLSRHEASESVARLMSRSTVIGTDPGILADARSLSARHNIPTFDAMVLAAAAEARCDILYSEDFQPGLGWRGVEVVNPFA